MQNYKIFSTRDLCYTTYSQAVSNKINIYVAQLCIQLLFDWVGAVLAATAAGAVFATPYAVKMLHS